ncbi:MAG TPA: carbohydrate ABC transporter permease, partial [Candidatus Tectomicrobia bacterium]
MEVRVGETFRKRLIVFYIPLFMFLVALLFPFYWMLITSLKPDFELYNARNAPFFVWHPTLAHWWLLFKQTIFTRWAWNTLWIATAS